MSEFNYSENSHWKPTCDRPGCENRAGGISYCDSCANRGEKA